jgi:hypothetical protein
MEPAIARIQNRKRRRRNSDHLEYLKIALLNCRKFRLEQQLEVMAPKIKATCESGFTFYYSVKNSEDQSDDLIEDMLVTNSSDQQIFFEQNQSVSENSSEPEMTQAEWDPLEPFKALDSFTESAINISNDSDDSDVVQAYQLLQELMVSANAAESIISKNKITNDSTSSTICTDTLLMLKLASNSLHPKHMLDQRLVL